MRVEKRLERDVEEDVIKGAAGLQNTGDAPGGEGKGWKVRLGCEKWDAAGSDFAGVIIGKAEGMWTYLSSNFSNRLRSRAPGTRRRTSIVLRRKQQKARNVKEYVSWLLQG